MSATDVDTKDALRVAIRRAKHVYVQPRFGTSERWVQITKREARVILDGIPDGASPYQLEMDIFATVSDGGMSVFLG